MNSVLHILQLAWCKIRDPKTSEYIGKVKQNIFNIGTGLQDFLKVFRTTVDNTQDIVDDFKDKTPKPSKADEVYKGESKKDRVEE